VRAITTLFTLLLLWGCFPGPGGYVEVFSTDGDGAEGPADKWPQDTQAILAWMTGLEIRTPVIDPSAMDEYCARAGVPSQQVGELPLTTSFLENGLDQTFMFINSYVGLAGKEVVFSKPSLILKNFYNMDLEEIPGPGPNMISPGTVLLVGIAATENETPSIRFEDTYLLKLDTGYYVWYGNQKQLPNVQEAMDYGVYDYLVDFSEATPEDQATNMNGLFAIAGDASQTIGGGLFVPNDFIEDGIDQTTMIENPLFLNDVLVTFNMTSVEIKKFFNSNFQEILEPETPEDIVSGTIVLIGIEAQEENVSSDRFKNMYLMYLDDETYRWYGNQNPAIP